MVNPTVEGNTGHTLGFVLAGLAVGIIAVFNIWYGIWVLVFGAVGYAAAVLYHILFAPVEDLDSPAPLAWRLGGAAAGILCFALVLLFHWKLLILLVCMLAAYILSKFV